MRTADANREYYAMEAPGRTDYWRSMAAPRFRMGVFLRRIRGLDLRSIIDLGCGSGRLLDEMRNSFPAARLCGMDFSERLIDSNRARDPSIEWRVVDLGERQSFGDDLAASFDVVLASEIIEHLDRPDALLMNAADLARPGSGLLLLSTQSGRVWETERLVGHRRHFTVAEMKALLEGAGWAPLDIWNAGFPFHDLAKWFANLSPGRTMRAFSDRPYGIWQKAVCAVLRFAYIFNSGRRGAQLFAVARRAGGGDRT